MTYEDTTAEVTLSNGTRVVPVRVSMTEDGEKQYALKQSMVAVRIGNGAKWHKPEWVLCREIDGVIRPVEAIALNKRCSAVVWVDRVTETTASNHVGSKIG